MTPDEHASQAQVFADEALSIVGRSPEDDTRASVLAAVAQVHATLALLGRPTDSPSYETAKVVETRIVYPGIPEQYQPMPDGPWEHEETRDGYEDPELMADGSAGHEEARDGYENTDIRPYDD